MKKFARAAIAIAAAAGIFASFLSCATAPAGSGRMPAWVTSPPAETAEYVYFIGSGSDGGGDSAAAEQAAVSSLVGEVTRYIGVRISSDLTIDTRASMEEVEERVTESIRQQSSAQLSDFKVVDKWIDRSASPTVVIYILGAYSRPALLEEKDRVEAIFREQQEASAVLEAKGAELERGGRTFEAVTAYAESALAAITSGVENGDIKFERTINKARNALAGISLVPVSNTLSGMMGKPFSGELVLRVTSSADTGSRGLADVPIQISYKELRSTGRTGVAVVTLLSDRDGYVRFVPPVPRFVGTDQVVMTVDIRALLDPLSALPGKYQEAVDGLRQVAASRKGVFEYSVSSAAASIPTGILIMDLDRSGKPIPISDTLAGVQEALTAARFALRGIGADFSLLTLPDEETIAKLRELYGSAVRRVVFGVARIVDFQESGGNFIVKVEGTVKTADLDEGRIIFTDSKIKSARGSNSASAISAAFKGLGGAFGEALVNNLP